MFDSQMRAKPILKWLGGKSEILLQLIEKYPGGCSRYVEPFLGGGAVFLSLRRDCPAVINDSNNELITFYRTIRDFPQEVMKALDELKSQYSEIFFKDLRSKNLIEPVALSARMLFLNKTCFNGLYRLNSSGKFNAPFGHRPKCPGLYARENFLNVSERLTHADIQNSDFETIIDSTQKGDLVYCDPPYVPLSKTSKFDKYTPGGFSQVDHKRLRDACNRAYQRGALPMVSNSAAEFVRDLYFKWYVYEIQAKRSVNPNGAGRGKITELLMAPFPFFGASKGD